MSRRQTIIMRSAVMLTVSILILLSCRSPGDPPPAEPEVDPALLDENYLREVVRHLYRWYLDENDVEKEAEREHFVFWARELRPELDPGDFSRFGEIVIPELDLHVTVKKPDYPIRHSDRRATSEVYKIVNVARYPEPPVRPEEYREVRLSHSELREHLFLTRYEARYPEGELLERMREAFRGQLKGDTFPLLDPADPDNRVVHLSPLSPVANEVWVFWEAGRDLIHFSSDLDLEHPETWENELPTVEVFDIDEQTVVSLEEAAGSNAYLTRDQVGRALYNCIILGRRLKLPPLSPSEF
jgi:hypothetical protein